MSCPSGALICAPKSLAILALQTVLRMRVPETPPEQPPFGMPHLGGVLVGEPTRLTGATGAAIGEKV